MSLVIGTVHPDLFDAEYCRCLVETLTSDPHGLFPFRARVLLARAPAGMLHVARNEIVRAFLVHPQRPESLLFIDTDVSWTPEQIWQLHESAARDGDQAMSGLLYDAESHPMLYDEAMRQVPVSSGRQRVFCTGMGFMLLQREGLERCLARYGWPAPWFDYGHRHGHLVSEDVIFAQRYAEMGIPTVVDTTIVLGHRKVQTLTAPRVAAYA